MSAQLAVVNVTDFSKVPGTNTYFRTSDVAPVITDSGLRIFNARGDRRSWGTPNVSSDVLALADDVIEVHVVGWHKWTISPVGGDFYFVCENGAWVRRTANYKRIKALLASGAHETAKSIPVH